MTDTAHEAGGDTQPHLPLEIDENYRPPRVTGLVTYCCKAMKEAIEARDVPFAYAHRFREYGIPYLNEGDSKTASWQTVRFCPWCGETLPGSLARLWFEKDCPDSDFWWEIEEVNAATGTENVSPSPDPAVETELRRLGYCCMEMRDHLNDDGLPMTRVGKFGEYGLLKRDRSSWHRVVFCPWCGDELPKGNHDIVAENKQADPEEREMERTGVIHPHHQRGFSGLTWRWNHFDETVSLFSREGDHKGVTDPIFFRRLQPPIPGKHIRNSRWGAGPVEFCCDDMRECLEGGVYDMYYNHRTRAYGIGVYSSGAYVAIAVCPWCGERLPADLGEKWHEACGRYGRNGMEGFEELPCELHGDDWWLYSDFVSQEECDAKAAVFVDENDSDAGAYCCSMMRRHIADDTLSLALLDLSLECAVFSPDGLRWKTLTFCPWCGKEDYRRKFWNRLDENEKRNHQSSPFARGPFAQHRGYSLDITFDETLAEFRMSHIPHPTTADDVTATLGVKPSSYHTLGDPVVYQKIPSERVHFHSPGGTIWRLESNESIASPDFRVHAAYLLGLLEPSRDYLHSLIDGGANADFYVRLFFTDYSVKTMELPLLRRMVELSRGRVDINLWCERGLNQTYRESMDEESRGIADEFHVRYRLLHNGEELLPEGLTPEMLRKGGVTSTEDVVNEQYTDHTDSYVDGLVANVLQHRDIMDKARLEGCMGVFEFTWMGEYNGGLTLSADRIGEMADVADEIRFSYVTI